MADHVTDGPLACLQASWPVLVAAQDRLHAVREKTHRNFDGGDAGHQLDHGLIVRHAVNYAVAVHAARTVAETGPVVDVGAGAGGFSVWAAHMLCRPLVIVDQDAGHRDLASRAFPDIDVYGSMTGLLPAPVVLAMEVIEHVARPQQRAFVRGLSDMVGSEGVLVMSTPDESGYWGGWSGYPAHVASLDAGALSALLHEALGEFDVEVLRIAGPAFDLSPWARVGVPIANRVWGALDGAAPRLTHEMAYRLNQLGKRRPPPAAPDPTVFTVMPADGGEGTGLIAIARRR